MKNELENHKDGDKIATDYVISRDQTGKHNLITIGLVEKNITRTSGVGVCACSTIISTLGLPSVSVVSSKGISFFFIQTVEDGGIGR